MESSSYYYNKMQELNAEIDRVKGEKEKYARVLSSINNLVNGLPNIKTNLVNAESDCFNGGFVDNGQPYGQGRFKTFYDAIENDISALNTTVTNINTKITNLQKNINDLRKQYDANSYNYSAAKEKERLAAQKF